MFTSSPVRPTLPARRAATARMPRAPNLPRPAFLALALATIVAGLVVHRGAGAALPPAARDVTGDALWAAMIHWWVGAAAPAAPRVRRAAVALGLCGAVELSQLVRLPALTAVRRTPLGHLVLGSDFDARDLAAYALGVAAAAALEAALAGARDRRRRSRPAPAR